MKILTFKEEQQLSIKERKLYYEKLREYLLNTEHERLTKGSLTICPKINPTIRETLKACCRYPIYIGGENVEGLVGIYSHSHQDKYDHINFIASNPNHTILLNSSILNRFYKTILKINGVIYMNKKDEEDAYIAKREMIRLLFNNKSITIFPESTWNLSPNKLLLPLHIGIVDMARKTGMPIIPVVQEYSYKNIYDGKEHIDYVRVRYSHPMYVKPEDNPLEKLEEVKTVMRSMRWELIREKGLYKRNEITNQEYISFLKASIRNLKNAGIDIKVEEEGIYGADNPFYEDFYINAVDYDDNGILLTKEQSRKLTKETHSVNPNFKVL